MAATQAAATAVGAGGTLIGVNVLSPLVGYIADALQLPTMTSEVQLSTATVIAGIITVAGFAIRTLWQRKFGGKDDPVNRAGV